MNLIKMFNLPDKVICGNCKEEINTYWYEYTDYKFNFIGTNEIHNYCNDCGYSSYYKVEFSAPIFKGLIRTEE